MTFDLLILLLVTILLCVTAYLLSQNLIFTVVICLLFILAFIIYEYKIKKERKIDKNKMNDLTIFIHEFIINFSIYKNIDLTIENIEGKCSDKLKKEINIYKNYNSIEKIKNLSNYFSCNLYSLFIKTVNIIVKNPDNTINISSFLMLENDFMIKSIKNNKKILIKSLIEFISLWSISFIILILLRFVISDSFFNIKNNLIYLIIIGFFYLFFVISILLFFKENSDIKS